MQRLHLVGFTSELDGLIFSSKDGARSGGYVVALDGELLEAIRQVLERRDRHRAPASSPTPKAGSLFSSPRPPAQGSSLSPRDIQARLRAGRSVEDVALEAGVDDDWVRRFATPVFAERAHVASRAQAAVLELEGLGASSSSLAGSVAANVADRGEPLVPDELHEGWDAYQLRETAWVVEFRTPLRGHGEPARWGFDTRTGRLSALNPAGAELGWVGDDGSSRSVFAAVEDAIDLSSSNGGPPPAPAEQLSLDPVADRRSPRRAPVRRADPAPPEPEQGNAGARPRRAPSRQAARGRAPATE